MGGEKRGVPASVRLDPAGRAQLRSTGPPFASGGGDPPGSPTFCAHGGGVWMWKEVVNEGGDLDWVVTAMRGGTGIWVTDGSYNKKVAPRVSGAGWVFYCTTAKKKLYGSFFERSPRAGSYRGELLGLLAIHTLAAALESSSTFKGKRARSAVTTRAPCTSRENSGSAFPSGRLRQISRGPSGPVKGTMSAKFRYEWVESHQDRYKFWFQLSLTQQLNCLCDSLAKNAVHLSLSPTSPPNWNPRLPREHTPQCTFVG